MAAAADVLAPGGRLQELWLFVVLGLTAGGAYALTALGVVAVYRGSGVLNFAHSAFGMVGTYAFWELYEGGYGSWSLGPALVTGIVVGALVGLAVYGLVMRPLRQSVEVARLIATLGVLLVLQGAALLRYDVAPERIRPFMTTGSFDIWGARLRQDTAVVLVLTVVLAGVLTMLFRRTRLGLSATALQERPVAAAALGISPDPTGMTTWAVGGALAAAAGIFLLPVTGLSPVQLTLLIFPAFAAGLLARFRSFPVTVAAGIAMGIFESVLLKYQISPGIIRSVPFMVIILALMVGGTAIPGRGFAETRLPRVPSGDIPWRTVAAWTGLALLSLLLFTSGWATAFVSTATVALVGLSIVVVTGYAGQISLAPFAIVGLSSLLTAHAVGTWDLPFAVAALVGVASATAAGAVIGSPAIRVRGLDLAVATLGFALAIETAVLGQSRFVGGTLGIRVPSPELFGLGLDPAGEPTRFAILTLVVLVAAAVGVLNLRKGRAGRRFMAIRANERGAAALGISIPGAKLGAFALSGTLAGLAGVLITFRTQVATFSDFGVFRSIIALGFTIVGGVGFVAGGVFAGIATAGGVGAYLFRNVDVISEYLMIISGAFVLYVMLTHPDGEFDRLAHAARALGRAVKHGARRLLPTREARPSPVPVSRSEGDFAWGDLEAPGTPLLRLDGVTVDYGPVRAVDAVSLEVCAGRVLGVIGPNGAGKTTLIDAITGFAPVTDGRVELRGRTITGAKVVRRARLGLARTFQNLELFLDMTVRENLLAASDARDVVAYASNLVVPGSQELRGPARAAASMFDLGPFLDHDVLDLPQGTQRLVAIARAMAAAPSVICLDEPTAGLTGSERSAVSEAVRMLVEEAGIGVLLVEHNVDVVAELCDDLVVLDFGQMLIHGAPDDVLASEVVRAAYLGTIGESGRGADRAGSSVELDVGGGVGR